MKRKLAREYILLVLGMGLCLLTFISLILWSKYYESKWKDQYDVYDKVQKSSNRFDVLFSFMSSCYHGIEEKGSFAKDFMKKSNVEDFWNSLHESEVNSSLTNCESDLLKWIRKNYSDSNQLFSDFYDPSEAIWERLNKEEAYLKKLSENVIPFNQSAIRNSLDYKVLIIESDLSHLSKYERNDIYDYLNYFEKHGSESNAYKVPMSAFAEFTSMVPVRGEIQPPIESRPTILSITSYSAAFYFIVVFVLRYLYLSVKWSVRILRKG